MRWQSIAEWFGFQAVWLVCALGAASGMNAPGTAAATVFVLAVLALKGWPRADVSAVLCSGAAGFVVESALAMSGLVRYAATAPDACLAPLWIVALWLAFGATLGALESLLTGRATAAFALLGAITGPLAYWAGQRLGALDIAAPRLVAYVAVAVIWAVVLPLLVASRRACAAPIKTRVAPSRHSDDMT